jgi:hypothetical protein
MVVAPCVRGGAAAQASEAKRSGGAAAKAAAKAAGVIRPRARSMRRWL